VLVRESASVCGGCVSKTGVGAAGEIIARFEAVVRHWNAAPTPLVWSGKRAARRTRERDRRHAVGGSGAVTRYAIRRRFGEPTIRVVAIARTGICNPTIS
jgi:hypothetical protein